MSNVLGIGDKEQVKAFIQQNSDRGFLHYNGCNQVCVDAMIIILEKCRAQDDRKYLLIFIYI